MNFPDLTRHATLHAEIAASHPSLLQGRVFCGKCGTFRTVDAARCLREGWPKCHGATMSLSTTKADGTALSG